MLGFKLFDQGLELLGFQGDGKEFDRYWLLGENRQGEQGSQEQDGCDRNSHESQESEFLQKNSAVSSLRKHVH